MEAYYPNLKKVIQRQTNLSYGIVANKLGVSKTAVADLCNRGVWPRKTDLSKSDVARVLREADVLPLELKSLWDVPTGALQVKTRHRTKLILNGGPTMLKQAVLQHFGLQKDPFTNEIGDISGVYMTPPHQAALAEMLDAARNQKFLGIWGPVGSGKTTVLNFFYEQIRELGRFAVSTPMIVEKERCSPSTICDAIIADMLIEFGGGVSDTGNLRSPSQLEAKSRFIRHLLKHKRDAGMLPVVVIDEAHALTNATLKMLKRIHELQSGFSKVLSIILLGQEELKTKFNDFRVREVSARINLVQLQSIKMLEQKYINWKLRKAGVDAGTIFTAEGYATLAGKLVLNNPLEINVIASRSLQVAFDLNQRQVDADVVEMAYQQLQENAAFRGVE